MRGSNESAEPHIFGAPCGTDRRQDARLCLLPVYGQSYPPFKTGGAVDSTNDFSLRGDGYRRVCDNGQTALPSPPLNIHNPHIVRIGTHRVALLPVNILSLGRCVLARYTWYCS